jgi:hypothetical protein
MKRIYHYIFLISIIVLSCETKPILFNGPYFIRFTDDKLTEKESYYKPVKIQVHNAGPVPTEDITINYDIKGSAREGIDYTIAGEERGKVTIKKSEYFGYIEVQLINNANNILRDQNIIFTLLNSNNNEIKIGQGESAIGKTFTLTIQDDCLLGGYYSASRSAFSIPYTDITFTSEDCETYVVSNWDIDIFGFPLGADLTFIDNGDNTLTIPQQEEQNLPDDLATISGTGFVNPLNGDVTLTITLVDFEGEAPVKIIYKRE